MLKAAVIGLGIGHAHCAAYLQHPHTTLAAVCDLMPERLARVGGTFDQGSMPDLRDLYPPDALGRSWQELGVKTCGSLEEVLADPSIEVISLCTPDHTHASWARACSPPAATCCSRSPWPSPCGGRGRSARRWPRAAAAPCSAWATSSAAIRRSCW